MKEINDIFGKKEFDEPKMKENREAKEFSDSEYKNILKEQMHIVDSVSLESLKIMNDELIKENLNTRNEKLEGKKHPDTGVLYEKKQIKYPNGEIDEGVFPKFHSVFDVQLPEYLYQESDAKQNEECNKQLKEAIKNDPELAKKFTPEQLEQIMNGETPDGYTWHHNEETGKMQLVDSETHAKTGHTGGKVIWGGGKEHR